MTSRIAVTAWHLAAPIASQWHEWTDDAFALRDMSVAGAFTGGTPIQTDGGKPLFEQVSSRAALNLGASANGIDQRYRNIVGAGHAPPVHSRHRNLALNTLPSSRLALCAVMSKPNFEGLADGLWQMCDHPLAWWRGATGATGPGFAPVAACASGSHAVAFGARFIADGHADAAICSAWEAPHSEFVLAGYRNAGALSRRGAMRPFDEARDGFVPSAGLATLVLESEEALGKRGGHALAWLTGSAMRGDATAMTAMSPDGQAVSRAIEAACGGTQPTVINAHATATKLNDVMETRAIKNVFGNTVPVSATKPITGHWLGAAGALEAILAVQSLREKWLPPTLGLEKPDASCDLDYISKAGRAADVRSVLSLSYGFGGHIGALMFEK